MVAFGKKLKERRFPEWKKYYMNYKLMKKKVKQYAQQIQVNGQDRRHVLKEFSRMLDNQIEKIVLFVLEQQGVLASRIDTLGEKRAALEEQPDISQISELREAYRAGIGAVVGALSRNLADIQDRQGSYLSIYDQPSVAFKDPVIDTIKEAVGRLGSARAVNRRYISDCVPLKIRMQASAAFVSASALGMACGPALSGLLQMNFKIFSLTFNQDTLPGWVMALVWLVYLIWLWISFNEPLRETDENHVPEEVDARTIEDEELENGLSQPLLLNSEDKQLDEDEDQECDESEEASEESRKPATSVASAYRLLTPSVKWTMLRKFFTISLPVA
ncbi:hypothetical protein QJS04_geneDACA001001 [Acorus gramineus]|uniref:SPX domain-containing protein n=1 Tax=Acorus gramineus TaxID=55184 RepID=A0AAV9AB86_ACOGR|nr:hypothetical protein QJS04_geneDACA001001 [Acorus gramineus]